MSDEVGLAIFFAIETASESFGSGGGGGTSFAVVIVRATCLWIRLAAEESGRMRAASEAAGKRPIIDKGIWNAPALHIAAAITATPKHLAILPSASWPYIFPFFFPSFLTDCASKTPQGLSNKCTNSIYNTCKENFGNCKLKCIVPNFIYD
jgi:hypothetical protein